MAIAAGCPVAISDEHITTQLPFNGDDPHSNPEGLGLQRSHNFKEIEFLVHTRVRIIQSQIHGIQFFDQALPSDAEDYDGWVRDTDGLIDNLVHQVAADGLARSRLEASAHQCQVLLHRPCSRNITVSESSLIAAASSCIRLIKSHMKVVQSGGFVMVFELANSAFQAGMVLLYALRNHATELEQTMILTPGHEALQVLGQLLVFLNAPIVISLKLTMRVAGPSIRTVACCIRYGALHSGTGRYMPQESDWP